MRKEYDKKLFRLIKILNVLQDSKSAKTADLAAEFTVSLRTAQRDIARLTAAGFPIIEDELAKGVYRFYPGYSLKGLSVSNEEVSLLVSLCDVARHMGGDFSKAYKNIFAKVMNTREWDSPFFVMMPKAAGPVKNEGLMRTAQDAIEGNRRVRMVYVTGDNEKKSFIVEPLKLIYYDAYWYLAVRYPGQGWIFKNRLDRIQKLEMLDERFKPPAKLKKMLQDTQSIWFNEKRDKVARIKVSADAAPFFKDRCFFPRQKIVQRNQDGSIVLETTLCHYMEAIPSILRWIPHLTVLAPKELRGTIKDSVSTYLKAF